MGSCEDHKNAVRKYVEAFNRGDIETLRGLFCTDAIVYGVLGSGGLDQVIPIWQELHSGLAMQLEIAAIAAEGNTVAVRFRERGTFVGPFQGKPPTGKSYEIVALEWFEFRDGRIQSRWGARDSASIARQVGI